MRRIPRWCHIPILTLPDVKESEAEVAWMLKKGRKCKGIACLDFASFENGNHILSSQERVLSKVIFEPAAQSKALAAPSENLSKYWVAVTRDR